MLYDCASVLACALCQQAYLLLVAVLILLTGILVRADTAQASWDKGKCFLAETGHCYALSEWVMEEGTSESVEGAVLHMDTISMDMPEWNIFAAANDEMWVSWQLTGTSHEGEWLESGQSGGNGFDCCSLHSFYAYARKSNGEGYREYMAETSDPNGLNFYTIKDPGKNGNWCVYWGGEATATPSRACA